MGVLCGALFIVGGTIGAGFITGAELVRFFGAKNFLFPLILSCLIFFILTLLHLHLGKKHGGAAGVFALFGRGEKVVRLIVLLCAFVSSAGMLAGLDALLPSLSPLLSLAGLAVACLFLARGIGGISKFNFVLVPLLIAFVFFYARGGLRLSYPIAQGGGLGLLYAGMNVFFMAPVLMDAGREMKRPLLSSLLAAGIVLAAAVCILGSVCREGANAVTAEMPFLAVAKGKAFSFAVGLAILTSLVSSLYTPFSLCDALKGKKKIAAKGATVLAAFLLSRLGLKGIVGLIYPFIGGAGILFSALCILYDQLLEKGHKGVHARGEHAENAGRAHHEVELEHLPAVDDEVPEARP